MAKAKVVNLAGGRSPAVALDPAVFEAELRPHLLHAEVRRQLAARRSGTHATRNRAAVSGGGAKPYRQKGTGRARQGSIRSPQYAGGGVVFGPVPRSHAHKLPKKVRRAALCSALSLRQSEGALTIAAGLSLDEFRTKRVLSMLESLGVSGNSVLLVIPAADVQLEKSARNLPRVAVLRAAGLNVYDILRHERLVIAQEALELIGHRLGAESTAGRDAKAAAGESAP